MQVPFRVVFLTDGPARKVELGKREITSSPALEETIRPADNPWKAISYPRDLQSFFIVDSEFACPRLHLR